MKLAHFHLNLKKYNEKSPREKTGIMTCTFIIGKPIYIDTCYSNKKNLNNFRLVRYVGFTHRQLNSTYL